MDSFGEFDRGDGVFEMCGSAACDEFWGVFGRGFHRIGVRETGR